MNKKHSKQSLLNSIFIAAIVLLAGYSAFLTYELYASRSANESVDRSLSEMIFDLELKTAQPMGAK
jgi:hypothetical protein